MDYPFGHPNHRPHHHHHHREEEEYPPPPPFEPHRPPPPFEPHRPPPPPPSFYDAPPPPHVTHVSHTPHFGGEPNYYAPPPPQPPPPFGYSDSLGYPPPPQPPYASPPPPPPFSSENNPHHHHHHPHMPSFVEHHIHHRVPDTIAHKSSVRVYSKAEPDYSLSIRDGKVILARSNTADPYQHWIKEEKWSTKVKDEQGYPSFALVNKATGLAIKHAIGATYPVQLTPYNPDILDESVLWTESKDLGDSYRTIRMVNNIKLNVDALNGDKNHGGVHDGTTIVLWEWKKGENQRWKILPY